MSYQFLYKRLSSLYELNEAKAIVRLVLEEKFGLTLADIYSGKVNNLSSDQLQELEKIMLRLEKAEPVQYVLGKAAFYHRYFNVASGVLIPRPETEQLCQWVISDFSKPCCALQPPMPLQILDIGTGSGCIAITLALELYNTNVSAWDISSDALSIARQNAINHHVQIDLELNDILSLPSKQQQWDIIVSNPPYICRKEAQDMEQNVLDYEPDRALFVPDENPLLFYKAIIQFAQTNLKSEGTLYLETNPLYIQDLANLLHAQQFVGIEIKEDMYGKKRFIKAVWL